MIYKLVREGKARGWFEIQVLFVSHQGHEGDDSSNNCRDGGAYLEKAHKGAGVFFLFSDADFFHLDYFFFCGNTHSAQEEKKTRANNHNTE